MAAKNVHEKAGILANKQKPSPSKSTKEMAFSSFGIGGTRVWPLSLPMSQKMVARSLQLQNENINLLRRCTELS